MEMLGIRISGPLLSSAFETSMKPLIFIITRIIIIFRPLQALLTRWSYLAVRGLSADLKVILKIW